MKKQQTVYIIAGSNGSGKTTFALEYLPKYAGHVDFINADLIAKGLSPLDPDKMAFRASRLLLQRIREVAESKKNFAFETTLSGMTYLPLLRKINHSGYRICMFFLWIPNFALAIQRIKGRVKEGGHHVPEAIVRRRFKKTLRNLFHHYLPLLDHLIIFDNSSEKPRAIYEKSKRGSHKIDQEHYDRIMKEVNRLEEK